MGAELKIALLCVFAPLREIVFILREDGGTVRRDVNSSLVIPHWLFLIGYSSLVIPHSSLIISPHAQNHRTLPVLSISFHLPSIMTSAVP